MGKMLFIEACCDCRYFESEYDPGDLKPRRYICTFKNDRKLPEASIDLAAATPKWCPLPDWDGTIKDLTGE